MKMISAIDHLPCPQGVHPPLGKYPVLVWYLACECGSSIVLCHAPDAREFCRHARAWGHVVKITSYAPSASAGSTRDWKEWTEGMDGPGAGGELVLHRLFEGQMVCGEFHGVPASWPPNHVWTDDRRQVTCLGCKIHP